jgi:hypothetical protein
MPTKQLPFFLNSAKGSNLTPLGNAFDVKLDPPVKIPAGARDTRIFVQSASAVYSFPNVTVDNNKIELFYQSAGPPGTNTIGFSLTVVPGLYATLLELQHGIANAAIAAQVHKSNPAAPVTTVEDFTENYLEIRENVTLSRVEVVIKDQHLQITLDRENKGQDLFVNVLGFATTQTLHSPAQEFSTVLTTDYTPPYLDGYARLAVEWQRQGQTWTQARANIQTLVLYIPNRTYTAKSFMEAVNAFLALDRQQLLQRDNVTRLYLTQLTATIGTDNDASDATVTASVEGIVSSGNPIVKVRFPDVAPYENNVGIALQTGANPVLPNTEITVGTPLSIETTAWQYPTTPAGELVISATNAASIDNIHALQISAPGLAAGVHVNGRSGSASLCRFPINTGPGSVIQFEPINPIRNSYDMSGYLLSQFRIELLDQHGDAVDTMGEEFNCTVVIEYE